MNRVGWVLGLEILNYPVPARSRPPSASQTENFRDAFERASLRYAQIKEVLCNSGVMVCQFVVYRSFGLHVDKLCRDYSGESLRLRALDAVLRWKCYGCKTEVLKTICRQVFALELADETGDIHSLDNPARKS